MHIFGIENLSTGLAQLLDELFWVRLKLGRIVARAAHRRRAGQSAA
jgi:hypothetical protein